MRRLLVFALAGFVGQLVDGALGMAFGVTTSTVLLSNGFSPAVASASVHLAEVGTTLSSGVAHWRFGNVSWPLVRRIGIPGAVGAFAGATVLSSLTGDWLAPAVAVVLFGLGTLVIVRSARGDLKGERHDPGHLRRRMLAPLGLSAGFLDAVGGGGWGPVATPTLLAAGRVEPRLVIGSVNAAELLVTVAASAGFLLGLGTQGIELPLVLALLVGGVLAAPVAAWLVRHADASVLGVVVGTLLLVTNARTLLIDVGVPGPVRLPILLALAAAGAVLARHVRREHAARPAPRTPDTTSDTTTPDTTTSAPADSVVSARR
ncbi:MAG TPA: sulfite exporter TauE/SafE family protein [Acidimicrobiales bacterium]|nr:sulfite exporter TauE/SafE family protein [Acidimicrobiales bacterium]